MAVQSKNVTGWQPPGPPDACEKSGAELMVINRMHYNWASLGLLHPEIIGVISINLTYKLFFGPTLYVRGDHQSWLVTAYNSNVKRMASQRLTKYQQLTQQVISTYRWQCSCKRNWQFDEACGICQWVESSCWSLTSKIMPFEASRYF